MDSLTRPVQGGGRTEHLRIGADLGQGPSFATSPLVWPKVPLTLLVFQMQMKVLGRKSEASLTSVPWLLGKAEGRGPIRKEED